MPEPPVPKLVPIMTREGPVCPYCDGGLLDVRKPQRDDLAVWECRGCLGVWIKSPMGWTVL